jgi:hypothetical protein
MRKSLLSRRSLRGPTECKYIVYDYDKLLILSKIGFDGRSASWRRCRTVSHRASDARSRSYQNHWTRHMSAY